MNGSEFVVKGKRRQYLAAILVNLGAFSVGNVMGWTSPMIPLLMSSTPPIGTKPMTPDTISWIGSIFFIGSIVGTLFWGKLTDTIGRKSTCLLSAVPCVICWVLTIFAQNSSWIIISRLIVGLSISGVYLSTPIYVAEISEDDIRGTLVSYLALFYNGGLLFSYIVGAFTSYHILSSLCLIIPIIFLLTFCWFPESPAFLWSKGKTKDAEKSLEWFRGGNTLQAKKEISKLQSTAKIARKVSLKSLTSSRGLLKAIFISLTLMVGQIMSGSVVIITYAVKILQTSSTPFSPHVAAIIVGTLQFCFVFVSTLLVDKAGRKILLVTSYFFMALSLAILGGYLVLENQVSSLSPIMGWIPTVTLCVHVISYSIGLGPVTVVVVSEVLPQDIKAYVIAKLQMVKSFSAFMSIKLFPLLSQCLNNYGSFWFFGFWCLCFGMITVIYLPETKCKTFHEILKQFDNQDNYSEPENECEKILQKK